MEEMVSCGACGVRVAVWLVRVSVGPRMYPRCWGIDGGESYAGVVSGWTRAVNMGAAARVVTRAAYLLPSGAARFPIRRAGSPSSAPMTRASRRPQRSNPVSFPWKAVGHSTRAEDGRGPCLI